MWFITVTDATVTVIVFFHGNVSTVITEGSPGEFCVLTTLIVLMGNFYFCFLGFK